jgi:signal transduction histidine kinase
VRDITEIKQSEQHHIDLALNQERVQLLEDLISDLSHDIKTPLTSINNFIYLLGKNTEPAKQAHYLEKLASQTERLNRLVDDILAMSRLDKGPELQFTPLYLNDLLQSIVNGRHHAVDEKDIGLKLELDSDLPPIFGNETELGRAIANLLDNAVNYTPNGGAITLRTDAQVGQINVEIQDTGIGIDVSDMPHIFDRFFRADSARSTSSGGTGLGLAIAKRVIELHGGQISVESAPDKGSSFSFWLPTSVT